MTDKHTLSRTQWNVLLGLAGLIGIVAAYALIPSQTEKVEMLIADRQYSAAHRALKDMYDQGSRDPTLLANLVKTAKQFGDMDLYETALILLVEGRPKDPTLRDELLEFYKRMDRHAAYFALLEDSLKKIGKPTYFNDLVAYHRLAGRTDIEVEILHDHMNASNVSADNLRRLILLLAKSRRNAEALEAYRRFADQPVTETLSWDVKATVFKLMIIEGSPDTAMAQALGWLETSRDSSLLRAALFNMSDSLLTAGRADLMRNFAEASYRHLPVLSLSTGYALTQFGLGALALQQTQQLIASGYVLNSLEIGSYVSILINQNEIDAAANYLLAQAPESVLQEDWVALLENAIANDRWDISSAIAPNLTDVTLTYFPLIEAQLAYSRLDHDRAREILNAVDLQEQSSEVRRAWFYLSKDILSLPDLIARMQSAGPLSLFPQDVLIAYTKQVEPVDPQEFARVWRHMGGTQDLKASQSPNK
ncbi:hypothetical protein J0X15_01960 [Roseibium sp. CAU 1637]|uniref:Uncharacterized protein n=1 Tax=Roseibium limicola TaxID=2816037 RepID=A0A939J3R3_9HYPH|nr:hypothetical protein [Roseibium limicola]MBO0343970.1 hypothetical protein [Roseibium limicola]